MGTHELRCGRLPRHFSCQAGGSNEHSMSFLEENWAVVVPMANEEPDFEPFVSALKRILDKLGSGQVYFIVDRASKDATLDLCRACSARDSRFVTVWAPENRNLVDAYL